MHLEYCNIVFHITFLFFFFWLHQNGFKCYGFENGFQKYWVVSFLDVFNKSFPTNLIWSFIFNPEMENWIFFLVFKKLTSSLRNENGNAPTFSGKDLDGNSENGRQLLYQINFTHATNRISLHEFQEFSTSFMTFVPVLG